VELFSFQLGSVLPGMRDASTPDALELAARVQAMDLVITVDTMLAHLAGALGVRTWVLLPFDADWRWLADRTDSPWYPTARLWRQPRPGDWRSVLHSVRTELATCAR
jgi:ADP-heptose:LPS heptosyltransferase